MSVDVGGSVGSLGRAAWMNAEARSTSSDECDRNLFHNHADSSAALTPREETITHIITINNDIDVSVYSDIVLV